MIIVNFNSGTHLRGCVAALKSQSYENFEVILVDNDSEDDSLNAAVTEIDGDPRFIVGKMDENLGFAAGNNRGAARARGEWIATLNPDAFPEPDWLAQFLSAAESHPEIAMFGSMQFVASHPDNLDGSGDRYFAAGFPWRDRNPARYRKAQSRGDSVFEVFGPCAAAAFYRTDVFRSLGGFDERFFCYVEDVDLAFRFRLSGYRCLQMVNARVLHVGGGSGGRNVDFARYHGTRNLIWCFFKNMPLPLLILLLPAHVSVVFLLLLKAAARRDVSATAWAVRDAAAGLRRILKSRHTAKGPKPPTVISALDWNPAGYLRHRYG